MQNVVELLEKHNAKNKAAIVVIIEEFDMLTTTTYQRLLYSFLDMSQRGVVPVLLFGLSRRMASIHTSSKALILVPTGRTDVVDLLEKRIRSRLSHIQLCPFGELSFEKYCESVKEYLLIPENSKKASSIEKSWNRDVLDIAIRRVLNCDEGLTEAFQFAYNLLNGSTEFEYLEGLSVLELTILLGLANLEETQKDDQRINFKMLQKHVTAFIQKKCRYICQDKEQLTQAFQRLRKLELIVSPGRTTDKDHTMIEFQPLVLQVEAHTLRRFLRQASVPVPVRQWAECIDI
ncbi:Origin recognition complex subunit 4 [Trichuris trichiura]|uniref:Origin recognition complex subunit 4 n=1 Tax=Trichuris trichiura TaxID=36087 RepID=A0A077ZE50_TRITR|nr:Origin recognition complex subunit 4 [Trichuris trichiura]